MNCGARTGCHAVRARDKKTLKLAMRRLEHALGRTPLESEIAAEMGLPLVEYQSLAQQSARYPTGVPGRHAPRG
jgi:DNA-directed RNA polymerase specialized sigma subunit